MNALDDLTRLAAAGLEWPHPRLQPVPGTSVRDASVLVLFGPMRREQDETTLTPHDMTVVLQRRAATLSSHAGQVSFPGGRTEPEDADAIATALREAREETGLDPAGVEVLGTLPPATIVVSNHEVTPVLAWWHSPTRLQAVDAAETVSVASVPVAKLLNPANRCTSQIRGFRAPAFNLDGTIVWGFTGIVLATMFDELGWAEPWDESVIVNVA